MKITQKRDGNHVEIALEGRLDKTTVPQLEETLNDIMGSANSLTLDLGKLDYLSSAGLRVLLVAHEAMEEKGGLVVKNVNEFVRDVFEVTGFSDFLNIQ